MVPIETLDCVLRACYCFSRGLLGVEAVGPSMGPLGVFTGLLTSSSVLFCEPAGLCGWMCSSGRLCRPKP